MSRRPTNFTSRRLLLLTRLEDRTVPAALVTWDGGGADNSWTTPANWVGDIAPQAGQDLLFPAAAAQLTNVNDFPAGTAFRSIAVTGAGYQISGNAVSVTGGVTADIAAGSTSTLSLAIGGIGGLIKAGTGTLMLAGGNTYGGVTAVMAGILVARSNTALGAIGAGNETTVADGATLQFSSNDLITFIGLTVAEPIFFTGRGAGDIGAITTDYPNNTLSGPLTLTGDALMTSKIGWLTVSAGIGEIGGPRDLELRVIGNGGRVAEFTSTVVNTYTGTTTAFDGVRFDGRGVSPMVVHSFLEGTGTAGSVRTEGVGYAGGELIPGTFNDPGTLTTKGLDTAGVIRMQVRDNGLDRISVQGPVAAGGVLELSFNSFVPAPGVRYTLIDNDGSDPVQGTFAFMPEGVVVATIGDAFLRLSYRGGDGNDVDLYSVPASSGRRYAVGAGPGGEPRVNVYDANGALVRSFLAYDTGFRGGVHVASRDVTGDGVPEIITGAGPGGGPHVKVFDGETGNLLSEFMAFEPEFRGGVNLASAFLNPDKFADIIVGAGYTGGPRVKVYDGRTGNVLSDFLAYDPAFRGGVSVTGDDWYETLVVGYSQPSNGSVITGAGPGGGPHVRYFSAVGTFGYNPNGFGFLAYDASFRGGINVAVYGRPGRFVGEYSGGPDPVVVAPASGMGPNVRFFGDVTQSQFFREFAAYNPSFRGGVNIAVVPLFEYGSVLVSGAGPGGGPHVLEWQSVYELTVRHSFLAFDPGFTGGVFVG